MSKSFQFFCVFLPVLIIAQKTNLSVILNEENLDDLILQIFENCTCVIFYQCDEDNFVIPEKQLSYTKVPLGQNIRNITRGRCSNELYYCCKIRSEPLPQSDKPPSIPVSNNCGQNNVGSDLTNDNEFPWMVAVFEKKSEYKYKCGGSLIHPRVVVTEEQCVHSLKSKNLRVVGGTSTLPPNPVYWPVDKIIEYESKNLVQVALIILSSPIPDSKIICLPNSSQNFSGRRCTVVGWGKQSTTGEKKLKKVDVSIVDSQKCEDLLRNTSLGSGFLLDSSILCAGGKEEEDSCTSDGGGPLMCEEDGYFVQVGVVRRGFECSLKNVPGLYLNVSNYASWIERKLKEENV